MGRDDGDENKRIRGTIAILVRISVTILALPVVGFLLGGSITASLLAGLVGLLVVAILERRYHRVRGFPIRSVLVAMALQAVTLIILGKVFLPVSLNIFGYGLTEPHGYSVETEFSAEVKTMSVILPCANEMMFAVNTVRSLGQLTPKDVLQEVIVVDDGSTPPLEEYFKEHGADVLEKYPVKFIRHETFTGLINAKKQGGDKATGDVLTFLDCHVLPRDYGEGKSWSDGIMSRIAGNYKRIVVPSITHLDHTTWTEVGRPPGIAKCYLSFDVDFLWLHSEDDFVPIMSGGLLAMSRRWWVETGGYDASMIGWGGENIDQSLRAWLCGGEIVQATGMT